MRYNFFLIIFFSSFFYATKAQLEVIPMISINNSDSVFNQIENLIVSELFGCDVEINNIIYNGNEQAIGSFNYIQDDNLCSGEFNIDRGILMTTGLIDHAVGPNNNGDDSQSWSDEYVVDDFMIDYLSEFSINPNVPMYDAAILEFDVQSNYNQSIDFEVIFGSEEYTEWMSPYYSDIFCFFVSEINNDIDPNFSNNPINIMETADVNNINCDIENAPISVWNIRPYSPNLGIPGMNECLYIDNENGDFCDAIGYDGYTIPMLFNFNLLAEASYHVKMIILDGGGPSFDSGVFLRRSNSSSSSLIDFTWTEPTYDDVGGATVVFNSINTYNLNTDYFWDFNNDGIIDSYEITPEHIFTDSGFHTVTLQVFNSCTGFTSSISYEIFIDSNVNVIDNFEVKISVYPNPAKDYISIYLPKDENQYIVELIDFSGRVLSQIHNVGHMVNIPRMSKGVYYVHVKNNLNQSMYFEKVLVL